MRESLKVFEQGEERPELSIRKRGGKSWHEGPPPGLVAQLVYQVPGLCPGLGLVTQH